VSWILSADNCRDFHFDVSGLKLRVMKVY
jgi:hypothetical protein